MSRSCSTSGTSAIHAIRVALLWLALAPVLAAADSAADVASGADHACFARVWRASGELEASSAQGTRALRQGDVVHVGEHVRAGKTGEAVLQTADAGIVAVRPDSEMVPLAYAANAQPDDHLALQLVKGSLRLISGWVAKLNAPGVQIVTPTATIGVRGTDHEPYILSEDLAAATPYDAGSYDKVNRGEVVLKNATGEVAVKAGQVGFALQPPSKKKEETQRGLMTLLLPHLLDSVPDFYVPGRFEKEIEDYSQQADSLVAARLAQAQAGGPKHSICDSAPAADADAADAANAAARDWVQHFDAAVLGRNAAAVLALFAPNATVEATVKDVSGKPVTQQFDRKQFARSVSAAVNGLSDYRQQRQTLDAAPEQDGRQVRLKSHVVESGSLNGKPYRLESDEEYLLEQRGKLWLAVQAATTQQ